MSSSHTAEYMRDWRLRIRFRASNRPSNAKYRCADCAIEVCKGAKRCKPCGARVMPSRRKA